ncbi:thiol-disulfide oxidoreductase DCC family protein [Neisseriaceae bacterium B1]
MHKIFYDAECPICVREIQLIMESSRADVIEPIAIQGNEAILQQYGVSPEMAMTYLHALRDDGVMLSGMPAVRLMYQGFQGFAIVKLGNLPLLDKFADWIYPWFARNRYQFPKWLLPRPECEDDVCYRKPSEREKK